METMRDPNLVEILQPLLKVEYHQRAQKFEELLSLWTYLGGLGNAERISSRHRSDGPTLSKEERHAWTSLIQNGTAWEPRTSLNGMKRILQLQADETTIEQLVAQEKVLALGTRAASRQLNAASGPAFHTGYRFELGADIERLQIDASALTSACRKYNTELRWHNTYAVIYKSRCDDDFEDDVVVLLAQLLSLDTPGAVLDIWKKAKALAVHKPFINLLPARYKKELSDALSQILLSAISELSWKSDLRLELFSEGQSRTDFSDREPSRSASRFESHLHIQKLLERSHQEICSQYYESVVKSFVLAGNSGAIANTLAALPSGRCLFSGIAQLQLFRPTVLASMCRHPSWQAEGIIGVLNITSTPSSNKVTIGEWYSAQFLMRNAVLDNCNNSQALLAALLLSVYDEQSGPSPKRDRYSQSIPASIRMTLWRERVQEASVAEQVVSLLKKMLTDHDSLTSNLIKFALRILEVLSHFNTALGLDLSCSIASAYANLLKSGQISLKSIIQFEEEPNLFVGLLNSLAAHSDQLGQFLQPFDLSIERREKALSDNFLCHSRILIALCSQIVSQDQMEAVLKKAVDIISYATAAGAADNPRPLFDFQILSSNNADNEPWLVRLGRILAKVPDIGRPLVGRLLRYQLPALGLTYILWGAGSEFDPGFIPTLNEMLEEENISTLPVGHLQKLCTSLYHGGQYVAAENVARRLIQIIDEATEFPAVEITPDFGITVRTQKIEPGALRRHPMARGCIHDAELVIAASLIRQNRHAEIIHRAHGLTDDEAVRQIENLQAVAHLYSGQLQESQSLLQAILTRQPKDVMALSNLVSVYMAQKEFPLALQACATAKVLLGSDLPDVVTKNEVIALWQTNDIKATDAAIKALPPALLHDAELTAVRVQLVLSTSPVIDDLRRDIDALRAKDPRLARELDGRLAPLSELEIGAAIYGGLERRMSTFSDKCKKWNLDPEAYLNKQLQIACHGLAQHPGLTCVLNEDQLTQLLMWRLHSVLGDKFRVRCDVRRPGGHGPKKEGEADFSLLDQDNHDRNLVLGEAKIWDGPKWGVEKGMRQVFAVNNTGTPLFSSTIVYLKNENFDDRAKKTQQAIKAFHVLNERNEPIFQCVGEPIDCTDSYVGHAVRCFRSTHRVQASSDNFVTLYCILVDLSTEASKAVRAEAPKGPSRKPTARRSPNRTST